MNLTEEQLSELERLAGLFFSLSEIMVNLEIPAHHEDEFSNIILYENEHPIFKSYNKGRITAEIEMRQAIRQAALNGSNPAQTSMLNFYLQSKII